MPTLIGKNIQEASQIVSDHILNLRILDKKLDNDLPEGTIVSQTPIPGQTIKTNQPVFCVISYTSHAYKAPLVLNKLSNELDHLLNPLGIRYKLYYVPSTLPAETCVGQIPSTNHVMHDKKMIIYSSQGSNKPVLFPSLKHRLVQDVISFFESHHIKTYLFHQYAVDANHTCINCRIIDQKPLPGSIIDLKKPIAVQLQVG